MSSLEINKFFGRKSTLSLLKKRVLDLKEGYRQNIAFLGKRYIGKTTILKKFFSDLDDKDIIEIFLDLEHKDLDYFYHRFVTSLLYNFSKSNKLPLYEDISLLLENTQPLIPQTIKAIKKIQAYLAHNRRIEAYREILSLPQLFAKEADKYCVLILDEFHALEDICVEDVFLELGKKIMIQKRCLYVVTSSHPQIAKRILSEKLSLLFGDFEKVWIGPFDFKTSQEFVRHQMKDVKMGLQLMNFVIDFTCGRPLYLQLLCQELVSLSIQHKQNEIFTPLLNRAIENILFDRWGVLGRHFEFLINSVCYGKGNALYAPLLIALSDGKQKAKEVIAKTQVRQSVVISKLNRLAEMEIITKNGYFYYIDDKLFKYWITYVYKPSWKHVDLDFEKQRRQFSKELSRAIDHFNLNSGKDFPSRIAELLCCFEDESFSLNGRKYKLPLFEKVVPTRVRKSSGGYLDVIKAATQAGEWVVFLKMGSIGENDINSILDVSKNIVKNPKKRVLVSPSHLDENARIRALQERMWIWNEGELKSLLNFYEKPYIV